MTASSEESLFPGTRFARVLSLGASDTAHGLTTIAPAGSETVFDRLVAPLDAVVDILADDGARLGQHFVASDAGTAVRCGAYDVLYLDPFKRDDEGQIVFTEQDIERCRAEFARLMTTFLRACEDARGPVLFLRSALGADRASGQAVNLEPFVAAIVRRFPALNFRILIVVSVAEDGQGQTDHRVVRVPLPPGEDMRQGVWPRLAARLTMASAKAPDGGRPPGPAVIEEDAEATLAGLAWSLSDGSATPDLAWRVGRSLWHSGRAPRAVEAFALAYDHGFREPGFLRDHLGLLTGQTHYREVIDLAGSLRREGLAEHPTAGRYLAMATGHAKLALAHPRESELALAEARSASPAWLDARALLSAIAGAIAERRPFAFVRLGDGEARYLLGETSDAETGLGDEEAHAMGDLVWQNWFGTPLAAVEADRRADLRTAFVEAVRTADVLGASGPERLKCDTGHYGYLAWQEAWLRNLPAGDTAQFFTDAQVHRLLNAEAPFLAVLLEGQDVVGVISPHPELADALSRRLGIARMIDHVIPAEGRLPTAAQMRESLGPHFPKVYDDILGSLTVPRPGCVFLVAAGLLGKVYCARIKALGGIALDIGALADAWMGFDTRDGQFAGTAVVKPTEPKSVAAEMTVGCLSLGKTGSMALADAIRNAGFPEAVHLHYLGPRAIAIKRANAEPMLDRAIEIASQIKKSDHLFRFVTAVRDPIARILSHAFYIAEQHRAASGFDIVRDPEALIAWWEARPMAHRDFWSEWFDDTFQTTLGFDFRQHPFDHAHKSLRYESGRLRLVVLRHEDDRARREVELGWLLDRSGVVLRAINDAANQHYEAAYRPFLDSFVAPQAWLERYYEAEIIRHVYTEEERAAFRARWSRGRARARTDAPPAKDWTTTSQRAAPVRNELFRPLAADRTTMCLSMMKTGSTTIAAALQAADPSSEVIHLHHLGPLGRAHMPALGRPVDTVAARLEDPSHEFVVATCLRDPIARWISEAFHDASVNTDASGAEFIRDHDAFVARIESKRMMDYSTPWFDDSLNTTFGFDFRVHSFDNRRKSLRFVSDRLRLLVLRQEDPAALKEAELGWLQSREPAPLQRCNERSVGALADRYRAFLATFVAPDHWLDVFYETEVARHFYTDKERSMFRKRWGRAHPPVSAPAEAATSQQPDADQCSSSGHPSPAEGGGETRADAEAGTEDQLAMLPGNGEAVAQHASGAGGAAFELERDRAELNALRARLREGRAVDFSDYAYRPRERDWTESVGSARLRASFAANEAAYAGLLERFCIFDERFRAIPVLPDADEPHWENWWLPGLDAVVLYGLVTTSAPRTFMEIGSGHSTRFVRRAIRDHGLSTRIISIDPNPTTEIGRLCDEVVRAPCEDVPAHVFASLQAGDMLFFDGSHRSFQNSDSTVFFTEILPNLAAGVVYGLHDVFLPYDYPQSWTNRFYNEQYLLMSYLLGGAGGDEVVFPAHHVWREPAYAQLRNRLFLGSRHIDWLTSSFWMSRAGCRSKDNDAAEH